MFLSRMMNTIPYIGNLVRAKYLVVSKIGNYLNREMLCWSVRVHPDNGMTGLILSESDLAEAHFRYIKYSGSYTNRELSLPVGLVLQRDSVTKRAGAKPVPMMLVYFCREGGPRMGYLFAKSDMERIVAKTMKLKGTVKVPTRLQRILMWIYSLYAIVGASHDKAV